MASLTWERRDGQRTVFQLTGPDATVGRDPGSLVRIESTYVSKRHAVVHVGQQGYTIDDLNSSNGTLVNGQRVTHAVLKDGDRIELGAEVLVFSNPAARSRPAVPAGSAKKRPLMLAIVGGGGLLLVGLVLLILAGGSDEPSGPPPGGPGAAPAAPGSERATAPAPAPQEAPPATTQAGADSAPLPAGRLPPPAASAEPLPSNDPVALYGMAMASVKGERFVEARRLLQGAVRLDPGNASAQQRLREVDATISVLADRHMSAGQRAFQYLRYDDAILEWEQVLSMVEAADPRHQQAADGIRRARSRLVQR